jgi:hypothetical protein
MLDDGGAHASLIELSCVALFPLPFVAVAAFNNSEADPTDVAACRKIVVVDATTTVAATNKFALFGLTLG